MPKPPKCDCRATGGLLFHEDRWWCHRCLWSRIAELEAIVEVAVLWQKSFVHGRDITDEGYSVADEAAECALYEATTDFIEAAEAAREGLPAG
jgi:hypothetical protein